jgi:two-component system phosphate regulon response regulator PhoB
VSENSEDALNSIASQKPDLAIVDWMLPGMSGLNLCRKIEAKFPVIMLTARADPRDVITGLDAGADDYITKPFEVPVLLARVAAVLRRWGIKNASFKSGGLMRIGTHELDVEKHLCTNATEPVTLTPMEFRLFLTLAESTGKVLTRLKLKDEVQGIGVSVTERTIDQHVSTLRKKLGTDAELIETVRGVGYRVRER